MKYIDADRLRVIINQEIKVNTEYGELNLTDSTRIGNHAQIIVLQDILSIIDSLQQEQPECIEASVKYEEGFKAGRESGLRDGQKYVLDNLDSYGLCKPAEWSKEDEVNLKRAINICINDFGEESKTAQFLKSLPQRFNLQPQQKWSAEDEKIMQTIIKEGDLKPSEIAWFKALRLQPKCRDTYYDIIHNILAMLKDMDFTQITPQHRISLLNDIRVKCKNADELAQILDEPQCAGIRKTPHTYS